MIMPVYLLNTSDMHLFVFTDIPQAFMEVK